MLKIKKLSAETASIPILRGLTLNVAPGEIHALMGQNGSGKSTLAHVLAGHPDYAVTAGSVMLTDQDLLELAPEERATQGLFLAFQYPASIPGVPISHFLRLSLNALRAARKEAPLGVSEFLNLLKPAMKQLSLPWEFAGRAIGEGFSGGERKRLEMLQMLILRPKVVILDEIDSGLDIDAMKLVATAVQHLHNKAPATAFLIITHYQRLLDHIKPNHVHIVHNGAIVRSGGPELAHQLEANGYQGVL